MSAAMDIVERLHFDSVRCEMQFSKGVAGNIEEAADEIARLRLENWQLKGALGYPVPGDIPQGAFKCGLCEARAADWIEWRGGQCPLPAGTLFEYRLRNGGTGAPLRTPTAWKWEHDGGEYDIVAYRTVDDEQAANTEKPHGS